MRFGTQFGISKKAVIDLESLCMGQKLKHVFTYLRMVSNRSSFLQDSKESIVLSILLVRLKKINAVSKLVTDWKT